MLRSLPGRQSGISLIELMIGSAVGLIVLAGVLNFYLTTVETSADNLQMARLNQELRAVMDIMTRDIRRAGYSGVVPGVTDYDVDGDSDSDDLAYNPFTEGDNDIAIDQFTGEITDSCITYTYNLDEEDPPRIGVCSNNCTPTSPYNSPPYDTDNVEQYGFRLRDQAIEMRTGRSDSADNTFSCTTGSWQDVTDSDIEIPALVFTPNQTSLNVTNPGSACASGDACLELRRVDITLTGRLSGDHAVQQTITGSVKVRNDKYFIEP